MWQSIKHNQVSIHPSVNKCTVQIYSPLNSFRTNGFWNGNHSRDMSSAMLINIRSVRLRNETLSTNRSNGEHHNKEHMSL